MKYILFAVVCLCMSDLDSDGLWCTIVIFRISFSLFYLNSPLKNETPCLKITIIFFSFYISCLNYQNNRVKFEGKVYFEKLASEETRDEAIQSEEGKTLFNVVEVDTFY